MPGRRTPAAPSGPARRRGAARRPRCRARGPRRAASSCRPACSRADRVRTGQDGAMSFDINGLLDLWSGPVIAGPDAEAAFGRLYTDPVVVNGTELAVAALVERAALLQSTFESM